MEGEGEPIVTQEGVFTKLGDYQIIKLLGDGASCKVKLGKHLKTGQYHALKILKSKFALKDKGLQTELQILNKLQHPNLIQFAGFFHQAKQVKPSGAVSKKTVIALELAQGEDLFDWISGTGAFEDELCRYYFKQILGALHYCHQSGYCHRDLKPANILLSQDFQIKLADFGYSSLLEGQRGQDKLFTIVGTQGYMAPELVYQKPYNGEVVDLFAAAVILFVMRSAQPPWVNADHLRDPHYKSFVRNPENFWQFNRQCKNDQHYYAPEFINLINAMFNPDPQGRLNMQQLLNHNYLKGKTYTRDQVIQVMSMRASNFQQQEQNQTQNSYINTQVAYNVKQFRSVDIETKEDLLNEFPTLENERQEYEYDQTNAGFNVHYVKSSVQDAFEFLLCVLLTEMNQGTDDVELDDEEYAINATFFATASVIFPSKTKSDIREEINISVSFFKVGEDQCAFEFKQTGGNYLVYQAKVKSLKSKFLEILAESNKKEEQPQQEQSKEEDEEQQMEETKEDNNEEQQMEETKEDNNEEQQMEETKEDDNEDQQVEETKTDDQE